MRKRRFTFLACVGGAIVLMTALARGGAGAAAKSAAAGHAKVVIENFRFAPRELTVSPGTVVTWTNTDDAPHTVTSREDPPAFGSRALDTDDRFSFTFTKPGTYRYFCKVHPHMTAIVTVK